jgi:hypothetical protein
MILPAQLRLTHRGASEKSFIQKHPDWFRQFSHEIICSNASWPCSHWPVLFTRNGTEDPTNDHAQGSSVLKAVCRLENEGVKRMCLAIEIDDYYFPTPSASPAASMTPWQTFPPPPTFPASHTPTATPEGYTYPASRTPYRTNIRTRSPGTPSTPVPPTGDNSGGGSVTPKPAKSKIGAGVGIGLVIGLVIAAAAGFALWFFVIRKKSGHADYEKADYDGGLAVSL